MLKIKEILQKENVKSSILLLLASICICLPLLNKKLNIGYDDGIQHIARLMGTYQSIQEGQLFPVIMSKFCNGFGYSWNLFYSPVTAYVPLIFKLLGFSFTNCIKLFVFCVVFLSGLTMYFFTKEVTKNKKIALVSGIFYLFAPYRFTDMYLRNALAELTSFVFLPMVFQGLYGVLKAKPKREYLLLIGSVGLVLTHTVIAMYTALFCFLYVIYQGKQLKKRKVQKNILVSIVFLFLLTSFYLLPLLEHKLATQYEVFKPGRMERTEVLIAYKLNLIELIITPANTNMIYEVGLFSLILLLFCPMVIKKLRKKWRKTDFYRFYLFSLTMGLACLIMTLKIFPFEHLPAVLKMLQFSFRMLEFSSFFFAFVVAVNLKVLLEKITYKNCIFLVVALTFLSSFWLKYLPYTDNLEESRLWPAVRVTKETGRVHAGCASFEYLPSKAFENRSYLETRSDDILVLEGNAELLEQTKENTNLWCKITSTTEETKLELPYIYYLGYEVTLEQNGQTTKLKTYETDNGFVGVTLGKTEGGVLQVHYEGTFLMKTSAMLSILGVVLCIFRRTKEMYRNKRIKRT